MKIDGNNIGLDKVLKQAGMDPAEIAKKANPLNLFGGDAMGGVQGLFNGQKPGAPAMPGGNTIEDMLAALGGKKDKNNNFDTSNAGNGLFSGGKDMGVGAGAGSALSGIKDMVGGLIQNFLGGLFGGGGGGIMGMVAKVAGMFGGL